MLTCLAATFEDPTTFPLLSITSIPSESSLCLIKATLQMLAVAAESEKSRLCGRQEVAKVAWNQQDDSLEPTYSWEGDKSLDDCSTGRAQLVGILN